MRAMSMRQHLFSLFSGRSRTAEDVLAALAAQRVDLSMASLRLKETFGEMLDRNDTLTIRPRKNAQEPRD